MNSLRWLSLCAFALSLVPSFARADDPSPAEQAQRRVEEGLLKPLAERENKGSRFSRSRPMPRERRVRVEATTATLDKAGRAYIDFAVDVRFFGDEEWRSGDIVGCAYLKTGALFVKKGEEYRPASFLLGKNADPVPGVCEPAPPARS